MASATAIAPPPVTDPETRRQLEPAGPMAAAASADAPAADVSHGSRGRRRLSVILHGKRADETDVRAAVMALRSEGVVVDVKVTWESGDVEKFVKDIVKAHSADTIVAAGGDGTLNEVVAALIKVRAPRNIAVGLMPMGTSNDFAAVTGIPQDLETALRLCASSDNLRPLDVGLLNGEVFMNTATLGASSELGSETSHDAKKLLGPAAYLVTGMSRLAGYAALPVKLRFPAPEESTAAKRDPMATTTTTAEPPSGTHAASSGATGEQQQQQQQLKGVASFKGGDTKEDKDKDTKGRSSRKSWKKTVEVHDEVLNLTAGNSRQLASMVQACPDALLDDGLLDITYVTGGAVEGATKLVGELLARGLDDAQPANVHILRVPWIEVTLEAADPEAAWPGNRDGEPVPPSRRFVLEALPRRITMHLPEGSRALLMEGADPRVNAPVIAINRMRKGAFKAMLAQVRRFRRIIPGSRPWWHSAAMTLLARAPLLLAAFAAGYGLGGKRSRNQAAAVPAAATAAPAAAGGKSTRRQRRSKDDAEAHDDKGAGGGGKGRWRGSGAVLPFWRGARERVVA